MVCDVIRVSLYGHIISGLSLKAEVWRGWSMSSDPINLFVLLYRGLSWTHSVNLDDKNQKVTNLACGEAILWRCALVPRPPTPFCRQSSSHLHACRRLWERRGEREDVDEMGVKWHQCGHGEKERKEKRKQCIILTRSRWSRDGCSLGKSRRIMGVDFLPPVEWLLQYTF